MFDDVQADVIGEPVLAQISSTRAVEVEIARRQRKIKAPELLEMHREAHPMKAGSAEADLPKSLLKLPEMGADTERSLIQRWKDTGCEDARTQLILGAVSRQFRYLLKKRNVGADLMDTLQDAVVDVISVMTAPAIGESERFLTSAQLAALRALNRRHLSMTRQVSSRIGVRQKSAMNALLSFDIDAIRRGEIDAEEVASAPGIVERYLEDIQAMVAFVQQEDVPALEVLAAPSHEEDVLNQADCRHLEDAIAQALDDRARDIMRRRWLGEEREDAEVIAEDWKITAERVRQIERQSLKDLRAWFEGETTTLQIAERRKALAKSRSEKRVPKRLKTDRRSVKGVDLVEARSQLSDLLTPKEVAVIEARYFSSERVPTYQEIGAVVGMCGPTACNLEARALELLRARFPADPKKQRYQTLDTRMAARRRREQFLKHDAKTRQSSKKVAS